MSRQDKDEEAVDPVTASIQVQDSRQYPRIGSRITLSPRGILVVNWQAPRALTDLPVVVLLQILSGTYWICDK
jgi:hypothetical protein